MNFTYKILIILFLTVSQLSIAQKKITLFNGKNLDGWYAFEPEAGKQENALKLFKVEKHIIRFYGKKAGYIISDQSFKNFKLTVKFRWNTDKTFIRKSDNKNSGVMYLVPSDTPDVLWPKGYQFQLKEAATGDFIMLQEVTLVINGTKTEAGKSVVANRFADAEKTYGKWNTLEVIHINGAISQKLNGKLVNKGNDASVLEGRILLQYEGYPIDFRKVVVERL